MSLSWYGGFWEAWDSGHLVKFDPFSKIIHINPGIVYLDVKSDIYSSWKKWMLFNDNNNMWQEPAMRAVGGDPITETKELGTTFFLTNGWRIKPWDNHTNISINGNLYVEEGGRPIIPDDNGNDSVSMYVSNLVDSIIIDNTVVYDADAPVWDGPIGVTNAYQNGSLINVSWGSASDANEVFYKVFISNIFAEMFTPAALLGTYDGNAISISTESDTVSSLREVTYYIGVLAVDIAGNETINENTLSVSYLASTAASTLTAQEVWTYGSRILSSNDANIISVNDIAVSSPEDFKNSISDIATGIWGYIGRSLDSTVTLDNSQSQQLLDIITNTSDIDLQVWSSPTRTVDANITAVNNIGVLGIEQFQAVADLSGIETKIDDIQGTVDLLENYDDTAISVLINSLETLTLSEREQLFALVNYNDANLISLVNALETLKPDERDRLFALVNYDDATINTKLDSIEGKQFGLTTEQHTQLMALVNYDDKSLKNLAYAILGT